MPYTDLLFLFTKTQCLYIAAVSFPMEPIANQMTNQ